MIDVGIINPILPVYEFIVFAFELLPAPFMRYIIMTFILSAVFWLLEVNSVGG